MDEEDVVIRIWPPLEQMLENCPTLESVQEAFSKRCKLFPLPEEQVLTS